MALDVRRPTFEVPSYSLTGDILSYQRCGLQYRYYNGSSLPPSRPVQIWVGEFVHGVLEEAYRVWQAAQPAFPWPHHPTPWPPPPQPLARQPHDIGVLGDRVEARLAAKGMRPRNADARDSAYTRVEAAINFLGPHLFPLITAAEERISGTRSMPPVAAGQPRGDRFELTGIVDVISSVNVAQHGGNPLVQEIHDAIPPATQQYDLIVDYKAMRRPATTDSYWHHHEWQVQTYAWLRQQSPAAPTVGAGLIVYINELSPSRTDLLAYLKDIQQGTADVVPADGSADYYALHRWSPTSSVPAFTPAFRLRRAVRVIDVASGPVSTALGQIDGVVTQIEDSALREFNTGNIPQHWHAGGEPQDCVACDFRHHCPNPAHLRAAGAQRQPPSAPG